MLLVYPLAGVDLDTPSYKKNAEAIPLSRPAVEWFVKNTLKSEADKASPMIDIIGKAELSHLPPATIITAEIDPLMSDGQLLAAKLRRAGSRVHYENFAGVTHEFFGMDAVLRDADRAQNDAAADLRRAFKSTMSGPTGSIKDAKPKM